VKAYYDARALEYDEWYESKGRFAERLRPAWRELLHELADTLRALPPARTLDVACGTGFATRWLLGEVTGLDQSKRMLSVAVDGCHTSSSSVATHSRCPSPTAPSSVWRR
jgi:ubiquinone/menaquinone biosynthesis C-methylase UbiE